MQHFLTHGFSAWKTFLSFLPFLLPYFLPWFLFSLLLSFTPLLYLSLLLTSCLLSYKPTFTFSLFFSPSFSPSFFIPFSLYFFCLLFFSSYILVFSLLLIPSSPSSSFPFSYHECCLALLLRESRDRSSQNSQDIIHRKKYQLLNSFLSDGIVSIDSPSKTDVRTLEMNVCFHLK